MPISIFFIPHFHTRWWELWLDWRLVVRRPTSHQCLWFAGAVGGIGEKEVELKSEKAEESAADEGQAAAEARRMNIGAGAWTLRVFTVAVMHPEPANEP